MKWLRLKYWWRWNIAWQRPANGVFLALSPTYTPPPSQLSQVLLSALNQDLIQFTLKPGVQVNVYATRMSPGQSAASVARLHLERHAVHFGVGKKGGGGGCHSRVSCSLNGGRGVRLPGSQHVPTKIQKVPYLTHVQFFFSRDAKYLNF